MEKVNILGIDVFVIDQPELLDEIDRLAAAQRPALVNNVNIHACNTACRDPELREILNASNIVFCSGSGVKLGARLLGKKLGQRMTPPDWVDELFKLCMRRRYCVFFIGDTDEVVSLFARKVKERHRWLRIMGYHSGFFIPGADEEIRIMNEISRQRPDIILTGMGMPRQEKWAWRARGRMGKGVIIATGAFFRRYTRYEKRAPFWMTQYGFEWLSRLLVSPRKLFKRYVIGTSLFFCRIIKQRFTPQKEEE